MKERIYLENVVHILYGLADKNYQTNIWLNTYNPKGLVDSFVESANMLFDDCIITDLLENNEIILDRKVTAAFHELSDLIDTIDEYRTEEEIINDPAMELVRKKAAEILYLIEVSDRSESTVRVAKPGEI